MNTQELYRQETGIETPGNVMAFNEYQIGYVKWLEGNVLKNYKSGFNIRSDDSAKKEELKRILYEELTLKMKRFDDVLEVSINFDGVTCCRDSVKL